MTATPTVGGLRRNSSVRIGRVVVFWTRGTRLGEPFSRLEVVGRRWSFEVERGA